MQQMTTHSKKYKKSKSQQNLQTHIEEIDYLFIMCHD